MKTSADLRDRGLVAIVGAGPAGLTLARLLQTRGFDVRVFERDASATARPQGGSLDLRPDSGQRAILTAGLGNVFARVSRDEAKAFRLMDSKGQEIPGGGEDTHEDAGPEIDRGDLRRLLLESLEPGTLAWDHVLDDVTQTSDGRWRLDFAGQAPVTADLVVGADGIGSKVRARLTSVQPTYVGHTMLAANIRRDLWRGSDVADAVGEGSVMYAGGGKTVFVQRCNNDLILLYFSMKVPFDLTAAGAADADAVLGSIREAYRDWSPELLAMLTQIEGDVQRWPLSVMPPDHRWTSRSGLTMIGDAAHAMPPFTGKGVNLALFDALELANALSGDATTSIDEAVRGFEAEMQARSTREIGACLEVGRMFYGIDLSFEPERLAA